MSKHEELEARLGKDNVLVVNSTMEVKEIVHWQKAMNLILDEKVYMLMPRADGAMLHSPTLSFEKPLVITLVKYARRRNKVFNLEDEVTKAYVLQRDNHTCLYCGNYGNTVDHIQPKSRGGLNVWGNLVAACKGCNGHKSDRTPEEAGLKRPVIRAGSVESSKLMNIQSLMYEALQEISYA